MVTARCEESDMTSERAALTGVIGGNARRSKSPLIHNYWLKQYSLSGIYAPLEVSEPAFEAFVKLAPDMGLLGANVTIPFKERAAAMVDAMTERARRSGSVNTLIWDADGGLLGDSTDGAGFLASLQAGAPGLSVQGRVAAVLGAGGAVRAVAAALLDAGVETLRIANRTRSRAEGLAEALGGPVEVWDYPAPAAFYDGAALLVNGAAPPSPEDPPGWRDLPTTPPGVVATDMVYEPLETPFLAAAAAAGAQTVDGLGMLLHQARPSFEAWYGVDPAVTAELRRHVLASGGYLP